MHDINMTKLKEDVLDFVEKKGYKEILVEAFRGGEENGEIFIEGDALFYKSFKEVSLLFYFLSKIKISKAYFGKRVILLLSKEGVVYVIHGISFINLI